MSMDDVGIPTYSNEAYLAFQILMSQSSDLIVFIEDDMGIHLYDILLKRLFSDSNIQIHVEAVSGKKNVIDVYQKSKQSTISANKIPCFFIADSDFDTILEKKMYNDANFLYLERYSIENYLVDEEAGINFVKGRTNENRRFCQNKINFELWLNDISTQMKKLVTIYCTIQKLGMNTENSSQSISRFTKKKVPFEIDNKKVGDYLLNEVFRDYQRNKMYGFTKVYLRMEKKIRQTYNDEFWRVIPGKQLLQLFSFYLHKYTDNKGAHKMDFQNLACHCCDLSSLQFLKEHILFYFNIHSSLQAV
ncbi:DUF4435 domain-containing protein [Paenibacillus sp. sgz5001063]|uniref:DUF4435 domain-containing protein n=1 Tax=Paenibacillus sp. sgz5001063 TaxID=3242474 RepID=UPI0036D263ED